MGLHLAWLLQLLALYHLKQCRTGSTENTDELINYCTLPCKNSKHIACNNTCSTAPEVEVIYSNFNFRLNMLELHNDFRNNTAAGEYTIHWSNHPASNMQVLNYDMRLEFTAACWLVAYDTPEKSPCPIVPMFRRVAQNIYVGMLDPRTDEGVEAIAKSWFAGINETTESQIDSYVFTTKNAEAATTAVWALTTHIGCACVRKEQLFRVLCNYGPGGNIPFKSVFWRGTPRSECTGWSDNYYDNLCGRINPLPEAFYDVGNAELGRWKLSVTAARTPAVEVIAVLAVAWLIL